MFLGNMKTKLITNYNIPKNENINTLAPPPNVKSKFLSKYGYDIVSSSYRMIFGYYNNVN
jgi:hypothetical protein